MILSLRADLFPGFRKLPFPMMEELLPRDRLLPLLPFLPVNISTIWSLCLALFSFRVALETSLADGLIIRSSTPNY